MSCLSYKLPVLLQCDLEGSAGSESEFMPELAPPEHFPFRLTPAYRKETESVTDSNY